MTPALETEALGKRHRRRWALRDCTLEIPERAIVGLAGPNGAGKSTLLGLAVGMLSPTEGYIDVLGSDPRQEPRVLADIGYVAQDAPLYRSFTVAEMLRFARSVNSRWDDAIVHDCTRNMRSDARVSTLSAGERARLALALALGKRPSLLLLDEPFAKLDPLACREFLQMLMDAVAELEATVVIASHVVADIERVCDHIVLLVDGRVKLAGDVEELVGSHRLLTGARRPLGAIRGVERIVRERHSGRQLTLLVRVEHPIHDPSWSVDEISLEELLLAYMAPERLPTKPPGTPEPGALRWHG
ncbi:MAG: ATP-binding cassette domain-containing protein [Gaiellaceae bacterium]